MSELLQGLQIPIVQAPMGGGPSTPELAAAGAGGLGFLAAGYKSAEAPSGELSATRKLTDRFGVNLFVPGPQSEPDRYGDYVDRLKGEDPEAGEPRWSDDEWKAKLELLRKEPVAVVSFTFGCPSAEVVEDVKADGGEAWLTVTTPEEARQAVVVGADALIVQGTRQALIRGPSMTRRRGNRRPTSSPGSTPKRVRRWRQRCALTRERLPRARRGAARARVACRSGAPGPGR